MINPIAPSLDLDPFSESFLGEPYPARPPSLLLEVDPPLHVRTREVVRKVTSRQALLNLRPEWERIAVDLVAPSCRRLHGSK